MNATPVADPLPIIITASTSAIKTEAVRHVFGRYQVSLLSIDAKSGINAQPVNAETYTGALNRISDAQAKHDSAKTGSDCWVIAIENGIFSEQINNQVIWSDRAVIIMQGPGGKQYRADSLPVVIPSKFVDAARAKGFDKTTVGQVMAEAGVVASGTDPHVSLPPFLSRREYLEQSLNQIASVMEQLHLITLLPPHQPANALRA